MANKRVSTEPYVLECPWCEEGYKIPPASSMCCADDIGDHCWRPCPGCGRSLKVVAHHEVYFTAEKALAAGEKDGHKQD